MSELTASDPCPSTAATYSTEAPPASDSSISSCLPASNSNLLRSSRNHLSSNNFLLQLTPSMLTTGGLQDDDSNPMMTAARV